MFFYKILIDQCKIIKLNSEHYSNFKIYNFLLYWLIIIFQKLLLKISKIISQ